MPTTPSSEPDPQILPSGPLRFPTQLLATISDILTEQKILLQWRHLASRDPDSVDHRQISALIDNKENVYITLKFRGKNAALVINTIEKVSQSQPFESTTTTHSSRDPENSEGSGPTRNQVAGLTTDVETGRSLPPSSEKLSDQYIHSV